MAVLSEDTKTSETGYYPQSHTAQKTISKLQSEASFFSKQLMLIAP